MNPLVADLWLRAQQALKTAALLKESDPDASASRSYYAAFYAVSALFALDDRTFSKHATSSERMSE